MKLHTFAHMARKPKDPNPGPELIRFREKRKWQIALRRYVLGKGMSIEYAPYFGLDRDNIRKWFEIQFDKGQDWSNCGKKWQFDHIVPVVYFDFSKENELRMCWNFTNLRVEPIQLNKNRGNRVDVLAAKSYFLELYSKTGYAPCKNLFEKIGQIEISELANSENQFTFLTSLKGYLEIIRDYSAFEFELLNSGRTVADVNKEIEMLKKIKI